MKPVLILGTGPAGLMAAHACKITGVPFTIVGLGSKSVIHGAQFVHHAVPGLMEQGKPDGHLTYHVVGEPLGYRQKVYGDSDVPFVSIQNVQDGLVVPVWSIQRAYDALWDDIAGGGSSVEELSVTPPWLIDQIEEDRWARIISTIPRTALCLTYAGLVDGRPHEFVSQTIQVSSTSMLSYGEGDGNHVWYDGTKNVSWYRTSMIFGHGSTEWNGALKLPYDTAPVRKPISNTCQCFNGQVMFTGRYGAWRKGLLVHHAFADTWRLLHP